MAFLLAPRESDESSFDLFNSELKCVLNHDSATKFVTFQFKIVEICGLAKLGAYLGPRCLIYIKRIGVPRVPPAWQGLGVLDQKKSL